MSKPIAYGIDFGTTNTSIAVAYSDGKVSTLGIDKEARDPRVMRSIIYVSPEYRYLYGVEAVEKYLADVREGKERKKKRIFTGEYVSIGKYSHVGGFKGNEWEPQIIEVEVGGEGRLLQSLKTALSSKSLEELLVFEKRMKLTALIAKFLEEVKRRADRELGVEIKRAVLGRPVHWVGENDELAKERMEEAARDAGFEEIVFEFEQIGAAWDYGLVGGRREQRALVFDFGGGTLDLSVVKFPAKEVLANVGLPIGGDLFNSEIFEAELARFFGKGETYGEAGLPFPDYIYRNLKSWYLISLLKTESFRETVDRLRYKCSNLRALMALHDLVFYNLGFVLYEEVDRVKRELSVERLSRFSMNERMVEIEHELSRERLEEIIAEYLDGVREGVCEVVAKSGCVTREIDVIVTTGGSSQIPAVKRLLAEELERAKLLEQHAFTSVATGLARRAYEIFG